MIVVKMNENTVECSITAQELHEIGLTPDAVMRGDKRSMKLLEELNKEVIDQLSFDPAKEVLMMSRGPQADGGIRVHAVKMNNDDIQNAADQARAAAWEVLNTITQDRVDEIKEESGVKKGEALNSLMRDVTRQIYQVYGDSTGDKESLEDSSLQPEVSDVPLSDYGSYLMVFYTMEEAIRFAHVIQGMPVEDSALYKMDGDYYFHFGLRTKEKKNIYAFRKTAAEYTDDLWINSPVEAHITEVGDVVIGENALEKLAGL